MIKKRHIVLTALLTAIVTIILYNAFVIGIIAKKTMSHDSVATAKQIIVSEYVDKLTDEEIQKLDDAAIDAMVRQLGDPYSRYMSASDFEEYNEENEEDYIGVGIEVTYATGENAITILSPYDGSPAQKAGLLPGDKIIEVDGIAVTEETYDQIVSHIRGDGAEEGSKVNFKIMRDSSDDVIEIVVERGHIDIQTVRYEKIDDVGYIRVAEFKNRTEEEFRAAVETLKDMEISSLIIDLRNNPGGYAHTVISMCDMLLPEGVIAYLEDNKGEREYFRSNADEVGVPMAILINSGTASASELLAGSVQAYGLGIIVGEKSYGKAVGQSPYQLSSDAAIYLTNARYFTPKGECIDGKGIVPDIEVSLSDEKLARLSFLETEEDDQLLAAIDALKNKN